MTRFYRWGWIALLIAGSLTVGACSTTQTPEQEARRYDRMDYQARFRDFRSRCLAADGTIFIDARKRPLRPGMPEPGDRYYCY